MRWWNKQDPSARAEVERTKDFEAILSTMREPDELESILLSTTSGPEDAKLISPDGLFRLVLRCQKSENAKKFHEWVQDIEAKEAAKNKPPPSDDDDSDDDMAALFGRFGGGKKKDKEEILPNELPKVKDIWEDFASRNLLFNIATNDDWFFARKDAVSDLAKAGLLASNELKIYTLEMASNPEYLCVKGYLKFAVPPKTISDCLWPESKTNKPGGRAVWDPLHKKVKLLEELGRKGDTVVTQSQYVFEFPYEPSPVPPCELILLHTLRKVRGCPPLSPAVVVLTGERRAGPRWDARHHADERRPFQVLEGQGEEQRAGAHRWPGADAGEERSAHRCHICLRDQGPHPPQSNSPPPGSSNETCRSQHAPDFDLPVVARRLFTDHFVRPHVLATVRVCL